MALLEEARLGYWTFRGGDGCGLKKKITLWEQRQKIGSKLGGWAAFFTKKKRGHWVEDEMKTHLPTKMVFEGGQVLLSKSFETGGKNVWGADSTFRRREVKRMNSRKGAHGKGEKREAFIFPREEKFWTDAARLRLGENH